MAEQGELVDRGWQGWPWLLAAAALAAVLHSPSLELGFVGDDFEWWWAARAAIDEPSRLIRPFGGFRPANLWTLVADSLLYGTDPRGFHLTSLLFHLGCGALLFRVLGRFASAAPARAAVVLLWLSSPYSLKPAQSLCERFQPMLLLLWLSLVLLWPAAGQGWSRGRLAVVSVVAAFSALVKESWVVLPGFVLCLELCLRRAPLLPAVQSAAVAAVAPALYTVVYALQPPIAASYLAPTAAPAAKLLHSWAVFQGLTTLDPSSTRLGPAEAVAAATMIGLGWWAWRRRCALSGIGFAFYLLPLLPILTVPFLVTRYTAIPLAGFLMVVAAAAAAAARALGGDRRRAAAAAVAVVAALYFAHNLWWLRGDMADAGLRDQAHRRLLDEARAFSPQLPADGVVVGVRIERESPNRELLDRIEGVPKAYYERAAHPYALIKWAPLFSFMLDPAGGPLYEAIAAPDHNAGYSVVAHRSGGFERLPPRAATAADEAAAWRERGFPVELFRPFPHPPD